MILTEYNEERHIRNEKEISFQEGKNIGLQEGMKALAEVLLKNYL